MPSLYGFLLVSMGFLMQDFNWTLIADPETRFKYIYWKTEHFKSPEDVANLAIYSSLTDLNEFFHSQIAFSVFQLLHYLRYIALIFKYERPFSKDAHYYPFGHTNLHDSISYPL